MWRTSPVTKHTNHFSSKHNPNGKKKMRTSALIATIALTFAVANDATAGGSKFVFSTRSDARKKGDTLFPLAADWTTPLSPIAPRPLDSAFSLSLSLALSLSPSLSLSPPLPPAPISLAPSIKTSTGGKNCPCAFILNAIEQTWTYGTPDCPQCDCEKPTKQKEDCPRDELSDNNRDAHFGGLPRDLHGPSATAPPNASQYVAAQEVAHLVVQKIPELAKANVTAAASVVANVTNVSMSAATNAVEMSLPTFELDNLIEDSMEQEEAGMGNHLLRKS